MDRGRSLERKKLKAKFMECGVVITRGWESGEERGREDGLGVPSQLNRSKTF